MILLAKICHTMTLIVILMYFQNLRQIVPQEIILKTSTKHAILSQNLLIFFQLLMKFLKQMLNLQIHMIG